jgi:hypothetical protein
MPIKTCPGYKIKEEDRATKCEQVFWCEPKHVTTRTLCKKCIKRKNNEYHRNYLRQWRAKKKAK